MLGMCQTTQLTAIRKVAVGNPISHLLRFRISKYSPVVRFLNSALIFNFNLRVDTAGTVHFVPQMLLFGYKWRKYFVNIRGEPFRSPFGIDIGLVRVHRRKDPDHRSICSAGSHAVEDRVKFVTVFTGVGSPASLVPIEHYLAIVALLHNVLFRSKTLTVGRADLYIAAFAQNPSRTWQTIL